MRHLNLISTLIIFALLGLNKVSISQTCATCPGNIVSGIKASAFGEGDTATGNYSFVAGRYSAARNHYAVAIGSWSTASGGHSYVLGSQSKALT